MKRVVMLSLACLFVNAAFAQNGFGIRVAYNKSTATKPVDYADIKAIDRFQVGVFGKLDLLKHFFVRGNLIYNQKGNYYYDMYFTPDAGKATHTRLNYLEASADLGYAIKLTGKHKILVAAGPYLAYGLNGTEKGKMGTIAGLFPIDRKVEFTNSDYYDGKKLTVKPIDAGLNLNVGYQYRKYGLFFNYGLGLTNRQNEGNTSNTSYNRVASVGVSYSIR